MDNIDCSSYHQYYVHAILKSKTSVQSLSKSPVWGWPDLMNPTCNVYFQGRLLQLAWKSLPVAWELTKLSF